MKGAHELGSSTTRRRFAAGLVGGFAALAVGAAPVLHTRASLDVDLEVVDYRLVDDGAALDAVDVDLANHVDAFVPLFFTWDQKRKTRHNWEIDEGPVLIDAGARERFRIVAPGEAGQINVGHPAQLTVFEKGSQRWHSIQFTPTSEVDR